MNAPAPAPTGAAEGSAARAKWLAAQERSSLFWLRVIVWIATRLGRPVARWVLHPITAYFLLFSPEARRHSRRYLGRALGRPARWTDLYRHFHAFASVALDRIWLAGGRMDLFDVTHQGGELVDDALAQGRGAFLLGAHLGSFEALQAIGTTHSDLRVAMVMYPENARKIQSVLQAVAPDFKLAIIPIGQPGSALAVRDWLDKGGMAGLLGDRFLAAEAGAGAGRSHLFLGQPALFTDGPLRLAMMLRRHVIFMVGLFRGGKRYDIRFEILADFRHPPAEPAAREQLIQQAMARYVARLEALCLEAPYNWFNFYDYWQEDQPA